MRITIIIVQEVIWQITVLKVNNGKNTFRNVFLSWRSQTCKDHRPCPALHFSYICMNTWNGRSLYLDNLEVFPLPIDKRPLNLVKNEIFSRLKDKIFFWKNVNALVLLPSLMWPLSLDIYRWRAKRKRQGIAFNFQTRLLKCSVRKWS